MSLVFHGIFRSCCFSFSGEKNIPNETIATQIIIMRAMSIPEHIRDRDYIQNEIGKRKHKPYEMRVELSLLSHCRRF